MLCAIAGLKLNESNPAVAAFTAAYTRVVISPSRSQAAMTDADKAELARTQAINLAAMKTLQEVKTRGTLVLVFPAGTRFRPWEPETKRGVREIDSYIRSFDYMCFVAVNGNGLLVRQTDMIDDFVVRNILRFTVSPVVSCTDFRNKAREEAEAAGVEDKKQATVDKIMAKLEEMHTAGEEKRQDIIQRLYK
jgi:glycerol-3-phosphate O-acyltransferase